MVLNMLQTGKWYKDEAKIIPIEIGYLYYQKYEKKTSLFKSIEDYDLKLFKTEKQAKEYLENIFNIFII